MLQFLGFGFLSVKDAESLTNDMDSHLLQPRGTSEIAFVLFTDLVAYSELSMAQQRTVKSQLKDVALDTSACRLAERKNDIIYRSTGDGIALVFFRDPEAPVQCSIEISTRLRSKPDLSLRMGMHSGPVLRDTDVSDQPDVTGAGINIAQRVMDAGDAGHILLSKAMADILIELGGWGPFLHDLGEVVVKHSKKVHLYNFYSDEFGNSNVPVRLLPDKTYAANASANKNADRRATHSDDSEPTSVSRRVTSELGNATTSSTKSCIHCGMLRLNGGRSCIHCGR